REISDRSSGKRCRTRYADTLDITNKVRAAQGGRAVSDRGSGGKYSESRELRAAKHDVWYRPIWNNLECSNGGRSGPASDSNHIAPDFLRVQGVSARAKVHFRFFFQLTLRICHRVQRSSLLRHDANAFANGILVQPRWSRMWNNTCGCSVSFNALSILRGGRKMKNWLLAGFLLVVAAGLSEAQDSQATVGIPVSHQLTIDKCGGCHPRDAEGMMRRLSYMRTTPEVWEQAIKRMVRLNGLVIKPEEARDILRFLC